MQVYYSCEQFSNSKDLFWHLIEKGIENHPEFIDKYGEDAVIERIQKEVDTIEYGETIDYFLILWDIVGWCRKEGILTGLGRGCFLPNSKVLMENGRSVAIKNIKTGDVVSNFFKGGTKVKNVFEYDIDEEIIELEFDKGNICCTKDHKFLTKNRGYVEAENLNEEDEICEM